MELNNKDLKKINEAYINVKQNPIKLINESEEQDKMLKELGTATSVKLLDYNIDKSGNYLVRMELTPNWDKEVVMKPIIEKIKANRKQAEVEFLKNDYGFKITEPQKSIEKDFDSRYKWAKHVVAGVSELNFGKTNAPKFATEDGKETFIVKIFPRHIRPHQPGMKQAVFILKPNGRWEVRYEDDKKETK